MKLRLKFRQIAVATVAILFSTLLSANSASAVGPTNTALPTISGNFAIGQTITGSGGSWNPSPSSLSYQWYRCSTTNIDSCAQIPAATSLNLILVSADGGNYLQLQVTALSAGGGTTISSAFSSKVQTQPSTSVTPVITGQLQIGASLTVSTGTWINVTSPVYSYKWLRCSSNLITSCTDIPAATNQSYLVANSDIGNFIRASVAVNATLSNLAGVATSDPTAQLSSEPFLSAPPTISGSTITDEILTATAGSYNAFPLPTFGYQWQSCTSTLVASCAPIAGATETTYKLLATDIGKYFRAMVTATNNLGGRISPTALSTQITLATAPSNTSLPIISGLSQDRQILSTSAGIWSANPAGVLSYQWQICSTLTQSDCVDLVNEIKNTYTLSFKDVNKFFRVLVTSKNRVGSASATSALTTQVKYATTLLSAPYIIGFTQVGQKWISTEGTWSAALNPVYGYQWQNCTSVELTTCLDIADATQNSYTAQISDLGKYLRVKNLIVNQSAPAFSEITPLKITSAPISLAPPVKPAAKPVTINCLKGKLSKKVSGLAPKCPAGYQKK